MQLHRPERKSSRLFRPSLRAKRVTRFPQLLRYVFLGVAFVGSLLILPAARWAELPVDSLDSDTHSVVAATPVRFVDDRSDGGEIRLPEDEAATFKPFLALGVNDRIDEWADRYLGAERKTFELYLARAGLYREMIRERLEARGMPEELLYIPMIESGFDPEATSASGAVGIWQFMEATALGYGLVVTAAIDERRDPVMATNAALDYLEDLHETFGSWDLAVAAYNAGPETIRLAIEAAGGRKALGGVGGEAPFWELSEVLPAQARGYLPKVLAAALLAGNAEHFGFEVEPLTAYAFERVLVPRGTSLLEVAGALDLSLGTLRELNPHLIADMAPGFGPGLVRVPPGDSHKVVAGLAVPRKILARGE